MIYYMEPKQAELLLNAVGTQVLGCLITNVEVPFRHGIAYCEVNVIWECFCNRTEVTIEDIMKELSK